jgi:hypothetical protein
LDFIASRIAEAVHPTRIYLFGSRAAINELWVTPLCIRR